MSTIFRRWRKPAAAIGVALAAAATIGVATANADDPPPTDVQPQIVGGGAASEDYEWMAALNFTTPDGTDFGYTCGATLLFRGWAATAGHCVADPPAELTAEERRDLAVSYGMDPEYFSHTPSEGAFWVRVGSHDRTSGGETAEVTQVIVHEEFDWFAGAPERTANDVALLRLDHLLNKQTLQLDGPAATSGDAVRLLGWGSTEPGTQPGTTDPKPRMLQELDTTVASDGLCGGEGGLSAKEICVSNVNGRDGVCFGDSGSPAIKKGADGRWKFVGITSRGRIPCGSSPSIYTSAPEHGDWLYDTATRGGSGTPTVTAPVAKRPGGEPTYTLPFERPNG